MMIRAATLALGTLAALALPTLDATPAAAERRRRAPAADAADAADDDARGARRRRERIADAEDSDGPEARAIVPIKLDDLIEVAVRHAPDLARAKLERTAAKGEAGGARAGQQWVMTASAAYAQQAIGGDVDVEPLTVVREDRVDASLGLGRNLPTGGNVAVEVGFNRTGREYAITKALVGKLTGDDKAQAVEEFTTSHQTTARVTLQQPLVRGFGPDVALAAERRATLAFGEATLRAQLAAEEMVLDVVSAYWELAYAAHEVQTRLDSLELARRQEKLTREEIRAGAAPASALNAVLYEIAVREEAALRARTDLERRSLDVRRKAGLELGRRELVLRPGEAFVVGDDEWDVDDVLARSRKANRRLVALSLRRRALDVDVKVAANAMLPRVDVSVSGGLVGTGETSDAAFTNAAGAAGYQVMAGLTVQFELSGAAKASHAAAIARRSRVEIDRLDTERTVETQVVAAVAAVKSARVRVGLAEKAIALGEENVKAERASFAAQRSTNFEVMRRQSELAEANLRRGRAVADYHVAVAQLQYLSGMLLEQYRIDVRPGRRT